MEVNQRLEAPGFQMSPEKEAWRAVRQERPEVRAHLLPIPSCRDSQGSLLPGSIASGLPVSGEGY